MKGEITYNEANDLVIKNLEKADKSHDVAQMLVNIYFPELRPKFAAILQRRDKINKIRSGFKKSYEHQENCDQFIEPFWAELMGIDLDEKSMTEALFQISERYR